MSSTRARRKTAKVVNYAKEQDFSDDDIFEDEADREEPVQVASPPPPPPSSSSRKSRGRPRKNLAEDAMLVDDPVFGDPQQQQQDRPTMYTEKGYDPTLPAIRERFTFMPEYELDGSPKIELIVGRRAVGETSLEDDNDDDESETEQPQQRKSSPHKKKPLPMIEYEYLVKYKGRSYLHLEWKTGADLESMNKSAKTLYRRFLKKLALNTEEDLEDYNFDPTYAEPQKICDQAEQEITIELSDSELVEWEKEREKAMAQEEDEEEDSNEEEETKQKEDEAKKNDEPKSESADTEKEDEGPAEEEEEEQEQDDTLEELNDVSDFSSVSLDRLRAIVTRDGPYYPVVEGCDNPYRDGYITTPPKKPRASYLFFQACSRPLFVKKHPEMAQPDLMIVMGDAWRSMSEHEQLPFVLLAKEESEQYDKERTMMERAQKPSEMWQPLRRCLKVLERLEKDGFANIFMEPVDLEEFPDYEEAIEQPMDLGTVRTKLQQRKYQAPENFARDVRKIWNNCKIYNQHGSAIWHVADYMSKQFERLYHAWVLEFRERYLRWVNPKARPWEPTCRMTDGECKTPDDQMVLCDHCDAMYGMKCVGLKELPKGIWHCPDCKPKLATVKGVRMLSAVSEQAARKRAELGDTPKKTFKQTMYLVKWAGLGYEFCTWETREDVDNDALIEEYHQLNNTTPDEPPLEEKELNETLDKAVHINVQNAGGIANIPQIRSQLYAQMRAFQFAKFGLDIPETIKSECGPNTAGSDSHDIVKQCLGEMTWRLSLQQQKKYNLNLPPLLTGEYDAIVPITSKGLMMNVGEIHGSVAFLGYRNFADGSKGPAEIYNLIRSVGDKIIAVDGVSTIDKSFKEVILMLRESGKHKFAYMRFLENKYTVCSNDLTSVGVTGQFAMHELKKKFSNDRRRLLLERKQNDGKVEEEQLMPDSKSDEDDSDSTKSEESEDDEGSEGEFEPDSDDEEMAVMDATPVPPTATTPPAESTDAETPAGTPPNEVASDKDRPTAEEEEPSSPSGVSDFIRVENTVSLARRLLNIELDYSSDEGDDDFCYFVDGVDSTFTSKKQVEQELLQTTAASKKKTKKKKSEEEEEEAVESEALPVKRNEFLTLGEYGKVCAAVSMTSRHPEEDEFVNFPNADSTEEAAAIPEETKPVKRSTVKVEQVSTSSNEVIRIWASAEAAAATLQIPLNEIKQMLKGDYDEDLGDEVGGFRWRYAAAGAEVTAGESNKTRGSKKGKEAYLEFRDKLYDHEEPHLYKNENKLRDYQIDGVNWLASTWYKRHSCILADEMGLGKTVQIVAYIEHLYRVEKIKRPYLVVVPLSTVEHWRREFQGWTDMICCVYHDRQRIWRDVLREYEWYYADRPHTPDFLKFDVLVTTYDTLIGDFDIIGQIPWRVAVVDEAHRLRNVKGKLLECMKEISARGTLQYGYQSRVLMTGTPLQNNTQELWTLLNFIEPYKFPSLEDFQMNFGNMANREQVEALQKKISPYMLRRVKEDVAKDIPAKEETVIDVELTSIQKQYYRAIFEHNHSFLSMGATRSNAPKLMNIQMELRKCCNHPFLLDGVEQRETEKHFRELMDHGELQDMSPDQQQLRVNEHGYIQTSGKMVLLDKLLPKLRQEGHKILIFSQMVRMLDLLSEYCDFRNFRHERLDGRVRGTERQKAIDRFETQEDSFVFLLSTRAGGVGINLTAADICIIFDSDWNPQNDVQAQARCHRIGQTKDVMIYRLVTSRTFEQEMFDRASKKLGLEQAVLGTFGQENDDDKPTSKEMEQLLKKGAYALIEDENDEIGNEFCADDIESILAKRTRTRVVEGAKTASWLNKQGMVVSKSRFTGDSAAATANVDVDDPLFWQKVMPDFVTPAIMLSKLNDLSDQVEGGGRKGKGPKKTKEAKKAEEAKQDKEESPDDGGGDALPDAEKTEEGEGAAEKPASDDAEQTKEELENEGEDKAEETEEPTEKPLSDDTEQAKEAENEDEGGAQDEVPEEEGSGSEEDEPKKPSAATLSRTNQRKVQKFMSDLKSMMDGILEEAEDDSLPSSEKATCQKLLLTISIKENLFNEEQRHTARVMLKRLEGDRRRRCRTTDQFRPASSVQSREQESSTPIREELLILSKHQRKKRRQKAEGESTARKRRRTKASDEEEGGRAYVGEDGYLHHSDSEADWSDIGEDIYKSRKKRAGISKKEAKRRRAWASDKDTATAAGRPWPSFPRNVVSKVLTTVLDEVISYDKERGGLFSEPVPRDEFPEYYEQIEHPMDYGTMKEKLERGDYRSAQAMQKDFVLVMQNCLQFNAASSDIVKEARHQALRRPAVLKDASMKHNLFLAEDGSVLEVYDDEGEKEAGDGTGKKKRKRKRKTDADGAEGDTGGDGEAGEVDGEAKLSKSRKKKKRKKSEEADEGAESEEAEGALSSRKKKPRIRITLSGSSKKGGKRKAEDIEGSQKPRKGKSKNVRDGKADESSARELTYGSDGETPPKKKRKKVDRTRRRSKDRESQKANEKSGHKGLSKRKKKTELDYDNEEAGRPAEEAFEHEELVDDAESGDPNHGDVWSNISLLKQNRDELDGSFQAARSNFVQHGPWVLPKVVEHSRFVSVAKKTLHKMGKHDKYSIFAEPVTEDDAPGYSDVVHSPMDFQTMLEKVEQRTYGNGDAAAASFYEDFLLVFDNCNLYNEEGEVLEEAARMFGLLPEAFASSCLEVADKTSKKGRG